MPPTQAPEKRLTVSNETLHSSNNVDIILGLLAQKGVHQEPGNTAGSSDKSDPLEDKLNKPSLGEKIKAKLHKS